MFSIAWKSIRNRWATALLAVLAIAMSVATQQTTSAGKVLKIFVNAQPLNGSSRSHWGIHTQAFEYWVRTTTTSRIIATQINRD